MTKRPEGPSNPPEPDQPDDPGAPEMDHDTLVAKNAEIAAANAMEYVAPPPDVEPKLMALKLVRPIALGSGTRPRGLHIGHALTDPQYHGALDLESIQWAEGADELNEREKATLLANPHLIVSEQVVE